MRTCTLCLSAKHAHEFTPHKPGKDGLTSRCKACLATLAREKRARTTHLRPPKTKRSPEDDREARRLAQRAYRERHPDKVKAAGRAAKKIAYSKNKEKLLAAQRAYAIKNRDKVNACTKAWRDKNKGVTLVNGAAYKAAKRGCKFRLTREQRQHMAAIYTEAAHITLSTGIRHEVDHIVPLRHPRVCGLHVPWNLQVITAIANRQKTNRLIEELIYE